MTRADTIRLATIGTSSITERFAAAVIDADAAGDGIRIDVAFSRDAERGRAFADRIGAPHAATDFDALLHSGDVDAVYVGSPNGAHADQARRAIAAGVHVFLEKPATPTAEEFAELVQLSREHGVVVFEGMRNVYDPGLQRVAELLPQVGPVRLVSFGQSQYSARYDLVLRGETPNIFDPKLSGGAVFDLGVYPLSALVHLLGAPASVAGHLVEIATGADGAGAAVLGYPDAVAQVAFSKIGVSHRPNEIQGEWGTIEFDEVTAPREIALSLRARGGAAAVRTAEHVEASANNMVYEVRRFAALVRGEDPAADQARTLAVLRIVETLRRNGAPSTTHTETTHDETTHDERGA
ncbi:MAG: Gfo/Idh/MocA family oxidoreductase [Microbacterium sp.]|uniref:Gfo/Idh/MocA family protein n=1 Tax=Microbacterium sp. TaxID=51671 RepID=UPI001AD54A2C|nr:Gfo/Idh/MocA family oxidoreductase [Microbacterium sp.]MBN9177419.1 Gfo/Idh/MocA family oxidoreductase [Microbacterium sp.]